jgi:hypothetical protein
MFPSHHPLPSPGLRLQLLQIPSSAIPCRRTLHRLCRRASAFRSPSCFTLSLFCRKSAKITPLFSYSSALFKKECFDNSFPINDFRTLLQNTGGGTASPKTSSLSFPILAARHSSLATKSRRIRTYEKAGGGAPPGPPISVRQKPGRNIQVLPSEVRFGNSLAEWRP